MSGRPASEFVVSVATPAAFKAPVPICVDPSKNVTVPVGIPMPEAGVTVAENTTLAPTFAVGLGLVTIVVVPMALGTTCVVVSAVVFVASIFPTASVAIE